MTGEEPDYIDEIIEYIDKCIQTRTDANKTYPYEVTEKNFVFCAKAFAWHGDGASSGEKAIARGLPKLYSLLTDILVYTDEAYRLAIAKLVLHWVRTQNGEEMRLICKAMREAFESEIAKENEDVILRAKQEHLENMYRLTAPVATGKWYYKTEHDGNVCTF